MLEDMGVFYWTILGEGGGGLSEWDVHTGSFVDIPSI